MFEVRPRTEWQTDAHPVTGLPARPDDITAVVIHYPGGTVNTAQPTAEHLRRAQASYLASRGYSYGYNFVVDAAGEVWEVRGLDIRSASQGSASWNAAGVGVQLIVSGDDQPTLAQMDATRWLVAHLEALYRRPLQILGHRQVRGMTAPGTNPGPNWATSCPGPALWPLVTSGAFRPLPPDPPLVSGQEAPMILLDVNPGTPDWVRCVSTGTHISHVVDGRWSTVLDVHAVQTHTTAQTIDRAQLLGAIRSCVVKPDQPVPGPWRSDAEIVAAWLASGGAA